MWTVWALWAVCPVWPLCLLWLKAAFRGQRKCNGRVSPLCKGSDFSPFLDFGFFSPWLLLAIPAFLSGSSLQKALRGHWRMESGREPGWNVCHPAPVTVAVLIGWGWVLKCHGKIYLPEQDLPQQSRNRPLGNGSFGETMYRLRCHFVSKWTWQAVWSQGAAGKGNLHWPWDRLALRTTGLTYKDPGYISLSGLPQRYRCPLGTGRPLTQKSELMSKHTSSIRLLLYLRSGLILETVFHGNQISLVFCQGLSKYIYCF